MLEKIVLIVHVLTAISIIGLILLQQGKGADMGASFGSGSSQTVLGAQGGGNILTRGTAILAALFFVTSLGLAMYAKQKVEGVGQIDIPVVVEDKGDLPTVDDKAPTSAAEEELPTAGGAAAADAADEIPTQAAASSDADMQPEKAAPEESESK